VYTLPDAVAFLYRQLPDFQRVGATAYKPGLERILALLEYFGNPHLGQKFVHVGGTNGKGSSSHMIASILQTAGYKVGLYTSPHLKSFTERIRVNGKEVASSFVVDFVQRVEPVIQTIKPSFFEITVCMAFEYFKQCQTDISVIEVGMGGRLDSTNVINPETALITNISFDHQQFLGNTLPLIAVEKSGIIKKYTPIVVSESQPDVLPVFSSKAESMHATLTLATDVYAVRVSNIKNNKRIFEVIHRQTGELFEIACDLLGTYQAKNIAGVLCVVDVLKERGWQISKTNIAEGLANVAVQTGLKGRWQTLSVRPLTICDTGHNVGGIIEVLENIKQTPHDHLHFIIGMVADKDHDAMLSLLPTHASYYFTAPTIERRLAPQDLQAKAKRHGLMGSIFENVNVAISVAREKASANDLIFIGGSTFTVADIDEL
jgi:dihydrofolate synthase/folylpolyglutamate synthase